MGVDKVSLSDLLQHFF